MDVRLIHDPPAAGSINMAVDEALLEAAGRGESILRFYSWAPATLSLGYFQAFAGRDEHAASTSLKVVRRATGGGAIVHDHELTYSFVTPISQRFSADHQQLVQLFHQTLCESLANWNIHARLYSLAASESPQVRQPSRERFLCFQRRASDDVVVGETDKTGANPCGPKIAGSAQRRRRHALLQHGSVLLRTSRYAPELPGLSNYCKSPPTCHELSEIWGEKIAARLGVNLLPGEPTPSELRSADAHRAARYETLDWLHRR